MKTPALFRTAAVLFIALSMYFAATPIFARFGSVAGYLYCIVGLVLIVVLTTSLAISFRDERPTAAPPQPGS